MSEETDKQFVERMQKHYEVYNSATESLSGTEIERLLSLALRGAEAEWKPIGEAERISRNEILMWNGEKHFVGWWKSGVFWRERGEPFDATHFIPLTALGSPKDE